MRQTPVNTIRRVTTAADVNPGDNACYTYYPVVIIGAGESGICMGARLRQELNFDQFRIFDRRSGLGGTWYTNTYPGVACDIPAIMYSFSFAQNPGWTTPFPPGKEIVRYLYEVCAKFNILDKIQCDTNVKDMRWLEEAEEWELIIEHLVPGVGNLSSAERRTIEQKDGTKATVIRTERIRAKVAISAVGGLVEPKSPVEVPGIESFEGNIVHTARWDPDLDLKDKNLVVIGTGCSAAQVIPDVLKSDHGPKQITQLLRSPPWCDNVLSKSDRAMYEKWVPWLATTIPGFQYMLRKLIFTVSEMSFFLHLSSTEAARARRKAHGTRLLRQMRQTVPAEYHEIMTPNYEYGCKRRILDGGWYDSLNDARVDITSLKLTSITPHSVILGPERHYPPPPPPPSAQSDSSLPAGDAKPTTREVPCDILIMANGYQTNEWLHPLTVTGRKETLQSWWKRSGGARAYMGTSIPDFPNFFMLFGPNMATGHSSVILASENQTNYALNFIRPILDSQMSVVEVTHRAERKWTEKLQHDLQNSVFLSGGCVNWYTDRTTGWNSTVYPRSQFEFTLRCMFPRWSDWVVRRTRRGVRKLWLARLKTLVALTVAAYLVAYQYRYGKQAVNELGKDKAVQVWGWLTYAVRSINQRFSI